MSAGAKTSSFSRAASATALGWYVAGLLTVPFLLGMWGPRGGASEELRTRRLVVEDAEGRPRIVLAAPVDRLPGRERSDPTCGLVVLDEGGVDRVVVGAPTTNPMIGGRLGQRIGPAAGINFNDRDGNERGGLGVLDNDDRVVLGLDREGGEGVVLFVMEDYAGLMVSGAEGGGQNQRAFLGTSVESNTTVLNLDDHEGHRRFQITVAPDEEPRLEFYDDEMRPVARVPAQAPAGEGD